MAPRTDPYDDPLSYESAPSLSFHQMPIGTMYQGVITSRPKLVQSRDFETGNPATWPDGNPVMSVVLLLEVGGETRSLWAQRPSAMFAALVAAQKDAGGAPMEEGGTLAVKFIGETPNAKKPHLNPKKQYACKYVPPAPHADPFAETPAPGRPSTPSPAPPPVSRHDAQWAGTQTTQTRPAVGAMTPPRPGTTKRW